MNAFSRIVCGVDFSETSAEALKYAVALASPSTDMHAVHAIPLEAPAYFTHAQVDELRDQARRTTLEAQYALTEFLTRTVGHNTASRIRIVVKEGPVAESVSRHAVENGADLVVIGTHGRSGWNRFLLGSVAEKLIRMSSIPILAVRSGCGSPELRTILCAVNRSNIARRAFGTAAAIAKETEARLMVLYVKEPGEAESENRVCPSLETLAPAGCVWTESERRGEPAMEIIAAAREAKADLIVLGARHSPFADTTVLGSTVVRVTRHGPAPVLLVFADAADLH